MLKLGNIRSAREKTRVVKTNREVVAGWASPSPVVFTWSRRGAWDRTRCHLRETSWSSRSPRTYICARIVAVPTRFADSRCGMRREKTKTQNAAKSAKTGRKRTFPGFRIRGRRSNLRGHPLQLKQGSHCYLDNARINRLLDHVSRLTFFQNKKPDTGKTLHKKRFTNY